MKNQRKVQEAKETGRRRNRSLEWTEISEKVTGKGELENSTSSGMEMVANMDSLEIQNKQGAKSGDRVSSLDILDISK